MANVINLKKAFYMEPEEIVKYFESKGLTTSFDWHKVYEDAHARAFTVAKMTQIDLLTETHKMLTTAIKEGWSEGKFQKNATELFTKNGWTGFKEVINKKTGEKRTVELGTPRRIKKIFQCNMHSAYAAGRYKKQLENADVAPYLQYICVLDGKTRPEHRAMHGKVFRYDDKIWNTMYPPNGWNCRCIVRQLTQSDVDRKGLEPEESKGHLTEFTEVVGGKERTRTAYSFEKDGQNYTLIPDAGWNSNVGKAAYLDDILSDKIENMPTEVKELFLKEVAEKRNIKPSLLEKIYNIQIPMKNAAALNLSKEDYLVIQDYTNNSKPYNQPIIKVLQGKKITEKEKTTVENLSNVFEKAKKTTQKYTVYRGEGIDVFHHIKFNSENIQNFKQLENIMLNPDEKGIEDIINTLQGKTILQKLFMSTSFDIKTAEKYAKKKDEPRLLWTITAKEGANAIDTRYLSSKKWEEELLFNREQNLKIDKVEFDQRSRTWKIAALLLF